MHYTRRIPVPQLKMSAFLYVIERHNRDEISLDSQKDQVARLAPGHRLSRRCYRFYLTSLCILN
jgi:hypothetical protein